MVKVTVNRGMALEVLISRIMGRPGLHVIGIRDGIITYHDPRVLQGDGVHVIKTHRGEIVQFGKLDQARNDKWILDELKENWVLEDLEAFFNEKVRGVKKRSKEEA